MLRRIADHLFWMARYLERAEWRARLADVNYHLLVETPTHDAHPWAPLLAITGDGELFAQYYDIPSESEVLDFFTFDLRNPSSILIASIWPATMRAACAICISSGVVA